MNLDDSDGSAPAAKKMKVETGGSAEASQKEATESRTSVSADDNNEIPNIPFDRAVSRIFGSEDMGPDSLFRGRRVIRNTRMKSMPEYLLVQIQRYYHDTATWTQKKLECTCRVPDVLDLEHFRAGPKNDDGLGEGETKMAEEAEAGNQGASAALDIDEGILAQLMSMGFDANGCKRACIATGNSSADAAMEWVFAHMSDPDFTLPPDEGSAGGGDSGGGDGAVDQEAIMLLTSLGFSAEHCKKALKATGGNQERAADWLFSHAHELDTMPDDDGPAAGGDNSDGVKDGPGKYNLLGFVSHVGKTTGSGHYVAHIKKKGQWVIFDDEKVAKSENPPFEYGYLYFFKRQ